MTRAITEIFLVALCGSLAVPAMMFLLAEFGWFEPLTERQRNKWSR